MSVDIDDLRLELGSPPSDVISDSTLEYVISQEGTLVRSAARAAEIIARHFSLKADKKLGKVSYDYHEQAEGWLKLAREFRKKTASAEKPYVGGISESDKKAKESEGDYTEPFFKRDMFGGF